MPTSKNPASYRLSEDALVLIEQLAKAMGLSRTSVIEVAIRHLAKKEGIEAPKGGKRTKVRNDDVRRNHTPTGIL